ncbi:cytochrome oxidase maturation protein, cbb3-type [Solemya pervernicosa gill symbiont]|uniref:Cytochrome oxidase maturation protein, cbb3-type n=2 Tax=Gammaproteobacteria incertae sedis TaxID=118884 RepID=A0A1T2L792_9GAMM|nr:cbb3-type cytochrome oxidase assembly protein CcoS [Candidatus Reidiella endopervernicosa]OOZ40975.1 cytochrome oxidase maturation protein, cbb3-type [Solemya pervernicosa gill symbiont]QKQ25024.1 cbb3-type cytochrome oxidase assembly protein CcoS [Candidatus Reidiella endopervernicosa]
MDVIYGLIPLMILLGLFMVGLFIWTVRNGQYDDLDGDANRILMDDDDPLLPTKGKKQSGKEDVEKGEDARNWPDAD